VVLQLLLTLLLVEEVAISMQEEELGHWNVLELSDGCSDLEGGWYGVRLKFVFRETFPAASSGTTTHLQSIAGT
jgi:hypothetical protein